MSHQGRRAIPSDVAEEVNRWAFVSEKVLHGTPSGVDNSVSVFGGALAYTKSGFAGKKGGMEPIQGFKSLKFMLTDSKVPRDTKALVAGVRTRKAKVRSFPERARERFRRCPIGPRDNRRHIGCHSEYFQRSSAGSR